MRTAHFGGVVEALEPRRLLTLSLLADLNTTNAGSWAREPVVLDSIGYMFANDGVHGTELWRTDWTAEGTWMVKDINPGAASSHGTAMVKVGDKLFFSANDGSQGLWMTDGTEDGTVKMEGAPYSGQTIDFDGIAILATYSFGIWRTDGTAAGTTQIAPVRAGSVSRLGNDVYFYGPLLSGGPSALWKTDGTAAGTTLVRQFSDNLSASVHALNGLVYLWANDATLNVGFEPWSSDGTAEGTVPLGDLVPGTGSSALANLTVFNGAVYFTATTVPDPAYDHKLHLFRTDGTAGSVTHVAQVGRGARAYEQPGLVVYNGAMYFQGSGPGILDKPTLWRSDGTSEGTRPFMDLNPREVQTSYPNAFSIYNGRLYFKAHTPSLGVEMFSTDGTLAGTRLLKDIAPGSRDSDRSYARNPTPVVFNDRLFFRADDILHGMELWSTDGTADGTAMLKDINQISTGSFEPSALTAGPGGFHYFTGRGVDNYLDLWKTDGTAVGTTMVKDLNILPAIPAGKITSPTYANGLLLFGVYLSGGLELWRSDGTDEGTLRVIDIAPGSASGLFDGNLVKVGERVFFAASTNPTSEGFGLWLSDGTEAGTKLVKPADSTFIIERSFTGIELNARLLFQAATASGAEWTQASIFISDGTNAGTTVLRSGFRNTGASNWTLFRGEAYFVADTTESGMELWKTDGTPGATFMVSEIHPGTGSSSPANLVATSDWLYFTATDPTNGRELWRIGTGSSEPQRLTTLSSDVTQVKASTSGGVLFTTSTREIYRFDGSNVIPLITGVDQAPILHGSVGRFDYFTATTAEAGGELWRTDGTPAGTLMVHDLNPGPASSSPLNLSVTRHNVLFSAWLPNIGQELFALSLFATSGAGVGGLDQRQSGPSGFVQTPFSQQSIEDDDDALSKMLD